MSRKTESDRNESDKKPEDQSDWIDELYAEGQDELPPPALDARIQAAARSEVRRPWYLSPGRLTTLATAASLVLAAMVIYYVPEDPPAPTSDADQASNTAESPAPARQANTEVQPNLSTESLRLSEQELRPTAAPQADIAGSRAMARSPEPAAAPMESKKAERFRAVTDELAVIRAEEMRENQPADPAGLVGASADAAAAARLAELCGPLPGTAETRSLNTDAVDWYLSVIDAGSDQRYWRCQDGAWIELAEPVFETPSVEQ